MKPRLAIFQLKRLNTILKCTDKVCHSALEETDLPANNNYNPLPTPHTKTLCCLWVKSADVNDVVWHPAVLLSNKTSPVIQDSEWTMNPHCMLDIQDSTPVKELQDKSAWFSTFTGRGLFTSGPFSDTHGILFSPMWIQAKFEAAIIRKRCAEQK